MLTDKELTQKIINPIPNPIIITSGAKIELANKNFLEFFDYNNLNDFYQDNNCVCDLFEDKDNCFSMAQITDDATLWTDHIYSTKKDYKVSIRCKNGNSHIFNITVEKINDNYMVVFTNITAQEHEAILSELAYHDHLTKIYNRQMFDQLYKKQLANQKRHGDHFSLIMLDIDHFKNLNDTYGHDVGDKVLVVLAELITNDIRENDIFARWGGEEFMLLLPRTNVDVAYKKAQELRELLDNHSNEIPHFTASFGVTEVKDYDKEQSAFIRVDKALYRAKEKRNDVVQL